MSDNETDIKSIMKNFIKSNFLYTIEIESLSDSDSFIEKGIIDSTGVLELIDFVEEKFNISVENGEVIPENFDSFNNIEKYLRSKL